MISTREATADDVEFIVSAQLSAVSDDERASDDWDLDEFRTGMRRWTVEQVTGQIADSVTYVIEYDGAPAGRLRVVRPGDQIHLAGIQLLPEFRSKGIGSTVIGRILDEGRASGLPVVLEVNKRNPDAERLYARLGFERYDENDNDHLMRFTP